MSALYPAKPELVAVLVEVARKAALESNCEHPEDLAAAMSNAVEHAAVALMIAHRRGWTGGAR